MKKYLCLMVFISMFAHSTEVLLEKSTYGGHVPPDAFGWSSGIRILRTGEVLTYYKKSYRDPEQVMKIATLEPQIIEGLTARANALPSGKLVFENSPTCNDVPVRQYQSGSLIFAKEVNCVIGYLEHSFESVALTRVLDSFSYLSQ